ncbi:hypothetical protein F3J14_16790 [Burkholderia sp. Tr-862]|uniref:hypothetical protein n=1 Tax=Burkholderia sp. Tr-862 TaxID=2608331 RepID=UPI001419D567|nr:hypothetical protein [Burkholderia sp. Tr-862]MDP9586020.1 hypothetical protein [Burkholderia contaminans]NIF42511.1 hypothetical protein [Burkholderia sp. Tr-862]
MTLADFKQEPWRGSHQAYRESALAINPAPEYANSEVLLASLYRTIGFESVRESDVPLAGRDVERAIQRLRGKPSSAPSGATLGVDAWNAVLHGVLESPKLPNQSAKRFLQVTPLVPSLAFFSGSARLKGNPWVPGKLIRRMIWLGSKDPDSALALWEDLFSALSVSDQDDVFARWLEQETGAWVHHPSWQFAPIPSSEVANLECDDFDGVKFMPARQFTKDLRALIRAKPAMTRRQWISLLEAVLRLAAVSHVTWLCDVQARMWRCLSEALAGKGPSGCDATRAAMFPNNPVYMAYGGKALNGFKDKVSAYLTARLGINTVLWSLQDIDAPYVGAISSSHDVAKLCQHIRDNQLDLERAGTQAVLAEIREQEARALNCSKGIGANMHEFARHVLGQRLPAIQLLRGYDQGYVLKKRGNSSSSPWIVSLGPVAVLALVHCALAGMGGPRSIHRLGQHLAAYGIVVDRHDISENDLGHQLRMLGLVLDSPDAESGMLLLPPFLANQATGITE